jgi:hypothetical protein
MPPRLGAVDLWSSETSVNGTPPFYPPAGGVIFRLIEFPPLPAGTSPEVLKTAAEAFFADAGALDGLVDTSRDPWMHETPTTDYAVLLSGQLDLLLDDGPVLRLGVGDVVIQRQTNHAWHNPGVEPARLLVLMHGGTAE